MRTNPKAGAKSAILPQLALALTLSLAGCGGSSSVRPGGVDDSLAIELARKGEFLDAAELYLELATQHPRAADRLRVRAAEALREEGVIDRIEGALSGVRSKNLDAGDRVLVDLLLAESALYSGDPRRAVDLLTIPVEGMPERERLRYHELRARALLEDGNALASAAERARMNELLDERERSENEASISGSLTSIAPEELRSWLLDSEPEHPLRPWIMRQLRVTDHVRVIALDPHADGSLDTEFDTSQNPASDPATGPGYAPPQRLALILPFTGPLASAGASARDGFLAAYFSDPGRRPDLRIYDAGASAADAVIAYRLAVNEGAQRVVGPLSKESVTAVFRETGAPVPLIALNQPESQVIPPLGSVLFGLLPEDEGYAIAARMNALGLSRPLLLLGDDEWSLRAARALNETLLQLGRAGAIGEVKVPSANPGAATGALRASLGYMASIARHREIESITGLALSFEPARRSDFDATVMLLRASEARQLMPQLRLFGLDAMPMLASSRIYSGAANPAIDRELDGIQFNDLPWLIQGKAQGLPERATLARSLPTAAGAGSRLFALGHDAYQLVAYLDWLSSHRDAQLIGATGVLRVSELGQIVREPSWARFREGHARPLRAARTPK